MVNKPGAPFFLDEDQFPRLPQFWKLALLKACAEQPSQLVLGISSDPAPHQTRRTLERKTLEPRRTSGHLRFKDGPLMCDNPDGPVIISKRGRACALSSVRDAIRVCIC